MASTAKATRLTRLSHGAGCACKIDAARLTGIRELVDPAEDEALIVGLDPPDDAAVYRLADDLALVQTIDFFTPIVDDPFEFGRIAAANALSDVYAMGATPRVALNLLAYPIDSLGTDSLAEILRGGSEVVTAAGASIAGGHSIDDPEPKYGLAVTGTAHPAEILTKGGGLANDLLFLTKPIGAGLFATAAKRGRISAGALAAAIAVMTELNGGAAAQARRAGVHAMTDITGFGLLGHLHELCAASSLAAEIEAPAVPAIEGALELASDLACISGGSRRNAAHSSTFTEWVPNVGETRKTLLTDAMTSGGLLLAVPPAMAARAPGVPIGRLLEGPAGTVRVR